MMTLSIDTGGRRSRITNSIADSMTNSCNLIASRYYWLIKKIKVYCKLDFAKYSIAYIENNNKNIEFLSMNIYLQILENLGTILFCNI